MNLFNLFKRKTKINPMFTVEQLKQMIPGNKNISDWYGTLNKFLPKYEINTEKRIAGFIAQCAHESANFTTLRENLNYRWESLRKVFPKYFPTDELAKQYERKPEKIANRVYGNRMGNGDEQSGDGWKYAGKGLIQLTGKNNYSLFAKSINMPLQEVSDYLLTYDGAIESACWFWKTNNINQFCDSNDIVNMTRRINGGTHGLDDRTNRYNLAIKILGQ
jgi:putative chitinase